MALYVGTNTYVTLTEANEYFDEKLYADEWNGANDIIKEKALKEACKRINRLVFKGEKADEAQLLAFPRIMPMFNRVGVIGFTEDTGIPKEVKAAQCELALYLIKYGNTTRKRLQEQGVNIIDIGMVRETFKQKNPLGCDEAWELLKPYLAGCVSIK